MDFIKNLEKKMQEKNLNKSQLARGMGVAPSTVNSWFNRSLDDANVEIFLKI
ncbi:MAG: helix-turn-helix transcriptional regulator [Ruminococcus sp.]|nr:helix-turn-helix transcriptional regulator [Ruminococcus sp.]